jgi:D-amino-acid dehydrogenase
LSKVEDAEFHDVVVVGAGMVGTACAAWLAKRGHDVVLLDRDEPGAGTSFGNAGIFARYSCIPLNSPKLPLQMPGLVLSRQSPVTIDWSYILRMTPWLLRFLAHCTPARVETIIAGLASLSREAEAGLMPLLADAGATDQIRARGSLYLYDTEAAFEASRPDIERKRRNGATIDYLGADEIGQMEPNLARVYAAGIYTHDGDQFINPQACVRAIVSQFVKDGGTVLKANVRAVERAADGTLELSTDGAPVRCRQMVLAAGAFSRLLFGGLIERLPLQTERGYHVLYEGYEGLLSRPVGWAPGAFYMTPMEFGLRCAGTVELGGLHGRKRQANLRHIMRHSRRLLPQLPPEPNATWLGYRPTMPDSLPVIGRSQRTPEILFAFGHQHLGMTLGGITGRMIADIVSGTAPIVDPAPFAPGRF